MMSYFIKKCLWSEQLPRRYLPRPRNKEFYKFKGIWFSYKLLMAAELVTSRLAQMTEGVPRTLMRTLTWDQGVEMASHVRYCQ